MRGLIALHRGTSGMCLTAKNLIDFRNHNNVWPLTRDVLLLVLCYCTITMIIEWHNTRFSHTDWRIYASMNYVNIDLDIGLSPEQRQAKPPAGPGVTCLPACWHYSLGAPNCNECPNVFLSTCSIVHLLLPLFYVIDCHVMWLCIMNEIFVWTQVVNELLLLLQLLLGVG